MISASALNAQDVDPTLYALGQDRSFAADTIHVDGGAGAEGMGVPGLELGWPARTASQR